ncbi:MAG: acyl-CoA dehydrogenase family protein [Acidimicrobiales bacterium]
MTDAVELSESESEEFRQRCRTFLEEHATGIPYDGPDPRGDQSLAAAQGYQRALADAGLAGLTYPSEYGGQGLTKAHERIYREEYAKYPDMTFQLTITHGMCLPMLAEYGSAEHKERFLAKNISAEELWCQMFSEPGAGSDVASLQTKAELDGEEWVINGQKVWTTLAHQCDYGIAIARTDPAQPKHAGISMFILDMRAPGVEIRPIHQIDGGTHFNEVFFTDVRIPKDWLVGELNNGWNLATSMLMYERVAIGSGSTSGVSTTYYDRLIGEATKLGRTGEPVLRQKLMRLYSEEFAKSLVAMRTRAELQAGKTPGPGGSLGKLHGARISRLMRDLTIEVIGLESDAWVDGDKGEQWGKNILASFQASIAGGTDEIQKNIIGDRVLGLPRDISVDKGVAFNELKVGTQD